MPLFLYTLFSSWSTGRATRPKAPPSIPALNAPEAIVLDAVLVNELAATRELTLPVSLTPVLEMTRPPAPPTAPDSAVFAYGSLIPSWSNTCDAPTPKTSDAPRFVAVSFTWYRALGVSTDG